VSGRELTDQPRLERIKAIFWRMYEFSRDEPQYFALMFVDRSVPRINREDGRFSFARDGKRHIIAELQACIDAGELPKTLDPAVAMRALTAGVLGIAVLCLGERL